MKKSTKNAGGSSQNKKSASKQNNSNNSTEIKIPTLEKFLEAGAHFGHNTSRWNPKMEKYIYDQRKGVHIIDIIKTMPMLKKALQAVESASNKGYVLIVGTKGQAATMVENAATECGALYVNNRWPGGLFTNFKVMRKGVSTLMEMEEFVAAGAKGLVKKEELEMKRDIQRYQKLYDGIRFMDRLPQLIIVIDSKVEKNAVREANIVGVPIVALADTNCDPTKLDHPVPANDDSLKSISLFLDLFGQAIKKGKKSTSLIALRKDYHATLFKLEKEYREEQKRIAAMEAQEQERLRKLREGKMAPQSKSVKVEDTKVEGDSTVVRVSQEKEEKKEEKKVSIDDSDISSRVQTALGKAGYKNLGELKGMNKSELQNIDGIGDKSADEILEFFNK